LPKSERKKQLLRGGMIKIVKRLNNLDNKNNLVKGINSLDNAIDNQENLAKRDNFINNCKIY